MSQLYDSLHPMWFSNDIYLRKNWNLVFPWNPFSMQVYACYNCFPIKIPGTVPGENLFKDFWIFCSCHRNIWPGWIYMCASPGVILGANGGFLLESSSIDTLRRKISLSTLDAIFSEWRGREGKKNSKLGGKVPINCFWPLPYVLWYFMTIKT